ncbi:MAG: tRNA (cytidine(34)-2'-O)-methyltransferase [Spirochaetaceae bacterium]|nr:MAG: tRNA (cytidine(34)-2'-O)-methyltransferase [Spirochaetaceae bacterium]
MTQTSLAIVLVEPEIPGNTGNIARTCAAIGASLHLVHPLGFSISERHVRRAGLDYWNLLDVIEHDSYDAFESACAGRKKLYLSTHGTATYADTDLTEDGLMLVFGKETAGLGPRILSQHRDRVITIPMRPEARSLNLSNAVAIVAYECMRQRSFF